jgi:c(7)-type cytochrome triheme protein
LKPETAKVVVPLVLVLFLGLGGWAFFDTFSNIGYAPKQPIPFSHKIHAGTNRIPCMYCHSAAERSRHATIPPMNVCMNCHSVVAMDKPNVQTLSMYYSAGRDLPWIRVYRVPDYVYFSHRWHVAKEVTCQECHGKVENMDLTYQATNLKMGWCISCHRLKKASTECNTCHL